MIRMRDIFRLDLNLLRTFDALMTVLNVTRAAARLHLTQTVRQVLAESIFAIRRADVGVMALAVPFGLAQPQQVI